MCGILSLPRILRTFCYITSIMINKTCESIIARLTYPARVRTGPSEEGGGGGGCGGCDRTSLLEMIFFFFLLVIEIGDVRKYNLTRVWK